MALAGSEEPTGAAAQALSARSATLTIVAQSAARGITLGFTVVSTAIVARTVGLDVYADWVTVLSLVALLAVALDPGLAPVVVRRLAQAPEETPRPAALLPVRLTLAAAALAVVVAVTAALRGPDAVVLAVVLGAQVLPRVLVLNATPWLQADHRLHRQTVLEAVCAAVGLAALGLTAALGAPVWVFAAAGFLAPTGLLAVLVARELERTPSFALPSPGPQADKVRSVLREIAPLAGALVLTTLYTRLSTVFVNLAEPAAGVARFLFAFQFVEQAIVGAGIVAGALLPMLAERARRVDLLRDASTRDLAAGMVALGALGSAALVAVAEPLCRLIGGPDLAAAGRDLTLLSPMATIIMLAFTLGYVHVTIGIGARYLRINAVALVVNLAAHSVFTLEYGATAAARIAWITETVVVVLAFLPIWRASPAGRRVGLRLAAIFAAAVGSAELAFAGVLPPVLAGLVTALVACGLAARPLRRIAAAVLGGRGGATTPA